MHNAIHGLLRWRPWSELEHGADRVVVGARLLAMPGYPFAVEVSIAYELGEDGLSVTTSARNVGDTECPFGAGQHPYLSPGDGPIDDCTLQLDAATRLLNDERHQIPVGREPVAGTAYRLPRPQAHRRPADRRRLHRPRTRRLGPLARAAGVPRRRDASSCGSTSTTPSSRSTAATPSPRRAGAGDSGWSR